MVEIVTNLHMHTRYSDGSGSYRDIVRAALKSDLDAVIITDHNVLVRGMEGYERQGKRKLLVLTGEEIHDRNRVPQKNHLLVLGAARDLAPQAEDAAGLLRAIRDAGGLSFIAHLDDPAAPAFSEPDISWVDWSAMEFTGIELWNGLSELKTFARTTLHGLFYACFPLLVAHAPLATTLRKWDQMLSRRRVVAVGGSDAHALHLRMGLLTRVVYPYEIHFAAINTHLLLASDLTGNATADQQLVYEALASGHCFVGYDRPHSTRGFRFTAHGLNSRAIMGDQIAARADVILQAHLPSHADVSLLQDGRVAASAKRTQDITFRVREPGVYRLEAYRNYLGRRRGWIFSNPIYVR
jgi:hypothetical protein